MQYAIKIIEKTKIVEEKLRDCIKTEIQTMRLLRHPYVVKLYEVMTSSRGIILVMEYVKGGDFFDKIMNTPNKHLEEDESRHYFQQMIQALEYCHSLNIIHRDLKPQNILYDPDNDCIKIVDFGLSTLLKEKDQKIKDMGGTTSYLAPEIFNMSSGYSGQAADIWSVGVILYNCCTGEFPFFEKTIKELYNSIKSETIEFPLHLSNGIKDLFKKIFNVNPKNRYTIEQIKKHPWVAKDFVEVHGQYLTESSLKEIKFVEEDESKIMETSVIHKDTQNLIYLSKEINFDYEKIPVINCFELTNILAGNYMKNMFEPENSILNPITHDENKFKFICDFEPKEIMGIINKYFLNNLMELSFYSIQNINSGKFLIVGNISKYTTLKVYFCFNKINTNVYYASFIMKEGIKEVFLKIMNEINENHRNIFKMI